MSKNGHLSSAGKQAARALNGLKSLGTSKQDSRQDAVRSVGTARQFQQIFTGAAEYANSQGVRLSNLTAEVANTYLTERSSDIQQKQLNVETRALEMHLRNISGDNSIKLDRQSSEASEIKESRAYSSKQISYLAEQQTERMALSTKICESAGLRAHELHTLQKMQGPNARNPSSHRTWNSSMHSGGGREQWERYTVQGKGGLTREVRIPNNVAMLLEQKRLPTPMQIVDRGVNYVSHYDVMGGQSFSNAWSKCSNTHFGFSHGAHGLRHSFAQQRIREIQNNGASYNKALSIVSQELGHFRPEITKEYLR